MSTGYVWLNWLTYTAAGLAAFSIVWRTITRAGPLRWATRRLVTEPVAEWATREVGGIVQAHTEPLREQLTPNGGSSLFDKVGQVVTRLEEIDATLVAAHEAVVVTNATLKAHSTADAVEFQALRDERTELVGEVGQLADVVHELKAELQRNPADRTRSGDP